MIISVAWLKFVEKEESPVVENTYYYSNWYLIFTVWQSGAVEFRSNEMNKEGHNVSLVVPGGKQEEEY